MVMIRRRLLAGQFGGETCADNDVGGPHAGCVRSCATNKKSGPGFPAALPLFQPIRLSGYSTKERMSSILQKTQWIVFGRAASTNGTLLDSINGRQSD
jgi:hypothetical protein